MGTNCFSAIKVNEMLSDLVVISTLAFSPLFLLPFVISVNGYGLDKHLTFLSSGLFVEISFSFRAKACFFLFVF